jgi:hypothetical protein
MTAEPAAAHRVDGPAANLCRPAPPPNPLLKQASRP